VRVQGLWWAQFAAWTLLQDDDPVWGGRQDGGGCGRELDRIEKRQVGGGSVRVQMAMARMPHGVPEILEKPSKSPGCGSLTVLVRSCSHRGGDHTPASCRGS
jgi:hypothetical protein